MKLLKKVFGLVLALSLACCSVFALSACDGDKKDEGEKIPLTEEEKIALKNELYTAVQAETQKEYKGISFSADISVTENNVAENIGVTALLAEKDESEIELDAYMQIGTENEYAAAFLRGENIYFSDDTNPDKGALTTAIKEGNALVYSIPLSALMEMLAPSEPPADLPAGDDKTPGDGTVQEDPATSDITSIATNAAMYILPLIAPNADALIEKYIGKVGTADKTDEGGYALTVTLADVLDALMTNLTQAATALDQARNVKVKDVWTVPAVKEFVDITLKGVTAAQVDMIITDVLGLSIAEIKVTETMTVTEYLQAFTRAIWGDDATLGEFLDLRAEKAGAPAGSVTFSAMVAQFNVMVAGIKQMISVQFSVVFDANKQLDSYALDVRLDSTTGEKIAVSVEIKFLDAAPVLLDLTNADIQPYPLQEDVTPAIAA